jgi:hypothetical protein
MRRRDGGRVAVLGKPWGGDRLQGIWGVRTTAQEGDRAGDSLGGARGDG